MKEKIRVLLVDDHLVIREGLRTLLAVDETIEIAGEAVDGLEAIERVKEMAPRRGAHGCPHAASRWYSGHPAHQGDQAGDRRNRAHGP